MTLPITVCRICGNSRLELVLDLGEQFLTGVFPSPSEASKVGKGPLELVLCSGDTGCGLVQLRHSFPPAEMYGDSYGYRSGLNPSMVSHLHDIVNNVKSLTNLNLGDVVVDIGSNDGTTLNFFEDSLTLVGIDPSAEKYADFYRDDIIRIPAFFNHQTLENTLDGRKAKIVLSIAMMYDLESPIDFARGVASILDKDGIWLFEQSYLPTMVDNLAYDTVCHEHIEYYGLRQIEWILREAGLQITDVSLNSTNGGSIRVVAMHTRNTQREPSTFATNLIDRELSRGFNNRAVFDQFARDVRRNRDQVRALLIDWQNDGKLVCGLGASTKGNVLLQYLDAGPDLIAAIGDVNPDKFGCVTPGTAIPIVSESDCLAMNPDLLIVLPWHFEKFFMSAPLLSGQKLFFPLPEPKVIAR